MADEEALRARLRRALTDAMKQNDRTAVTALRTTLSAIDNSEAVARPDPPVTSGLALSQEPYTASDEARPFAATSPTAKS